jgi:peptidyl-prolyl cis-trans isomerase D
MAMMISKFHKLIQSRLLWGGFLIVIVFSFVVWGMVWPSDLDEMERVNAAGLLDGEPITHGAFRSAYLSTYMGRTLATGRDITATPENEAALRRLTWQRLATLREAARMGVSADEDELITAIRSNFTDENDRYLPQQYQVFLQNMIQPMGFTAAQFEQHVREEIIMQKLGSLIGRQAHVTPLEIRRTFDTLLDTFVVDYTPVLLADIEPGVEVSEEEARDLFTSNPEAFRLPERRVVLAASFPIADHLDEEAEFSDEEIQDYYELNIRDYTREETDAEGQVRETVDDLDDVRDAIVDALRRDAALAQADAAATELSFRSIPGRDGTLPDFAEEAEKSGHPAREIGPFSRLDLPEEDAGAAFTLAAFELDSGAFDRVSIPVAGKAYAHVIYLKEIQPPRVPEFEEVRDRALEAARQRAVANALAARATALQEAAAAGLAEGRRFAEALNGLDAAVTTTEPFTGLSASASEDDVLQALVQTVVTYNPGEVTDPIRTRNGVLVAHVASREPADPAQFGAYRDEIAAAIRSRRAQNLFMDWQAALLSPERFTDLQRPAIDDEIEEDEIFEEDDNDGSPESIGIELADESPSL